MPHEPPADIDWALAGLARAVRARKAAPAMDASLRIQSSKKIRGCRAPLTRGWSSFDLNLGVSP